MNEHERVLRRRAVHDAADVGIELIVGLLNATRDHEMLGGVFAPERPYVGSFKTAETMVTRDTYLKFSKSEITARVPRGSVSHSRTAGNAGSIRREKDRHNRQSSCSGRHIFGQRDRRRGTRRSAPRCSGHSQLQFPGLSSHYRDDTDGASRKSDPFKCHPIVAWRNVGEYESSFRIAHCRPHKCADGVGSYDGDLDAWQNFFFGIPAAPGDAPSRLLCRSLDDEAQGNEKQSDELSQLTHRHSHFRTPRKRRGVLPKAAWSLWE